MAAFGLLEEVALGGPQVMMSGYTQSKLTVGSVALLKALQDDIGLGFGLWALGSHRDDVMTAYSDGGQWIERPINQGGQITFLRTMKGHYLRLVTASINGKNPTKRGFK